MTTWLDGARFGMFVHWGHGSQRGLELSWPMVGGTRAFPSGELRISVTAEALDSHTTVVAIDFTALE